MTKGAGVRIGRRLAVIMVCCGVTGGLGGGVPPAMGESAPSPSGSSPLGGGLVVPEAQTLDEGQQVLAAEEAKRSSPEAQAEREASQTRFKGLDPEQSRAEAVAAFPAEMSHPAGGPPPLPAGQKITGFDEPNVAKVDLGGGQAGIIESTVPMATQAASGVYAAVDLSPHDAGNEGWTPANPLVPVRIPRHLEEGVQLSSAGLSLTPVDSQGVPLGGSEGAVDGATVDFANTQTDTDTIVKPSNFGVSVDALIRSVDSPEVFYYRVGMPQGARLVASSGGVGAEVLDEGVAIAMVKPPTATDATGAEVSLSMSVSGGTLVVTVHHSSGEITYPILVDPELSGYWQAWSNVVQGNWEFHEWIGYTHEIAGAELRMKHEPGSFANDDYAEWSEKTKGYTKIFDVYVKDELYPWSAPEGRRNTPRWIRAYMEVFKPGGATENLIPLSGSPYLTEATVCGASGCDSAGEVEGRETAEGNGFAFTLTTNEAGSTGEQFYAHAEQVSTGIAQEYGKHSTVSYNTGSSEIEGAPNVLAGSGSWIGPNAGKLEYASKDGGLGVSESTVEVKGAGGWEKVGGKNYLSTSACNGIQCEENQHEVLS